jgi:hypothetical protein
VTRTSFTIATEIEVKFTPPGCTATEIKYPEIEIEFEYTPGEPERGPTYSCGGTPASADEISFVSAKLIDGAGLDPTQEQVTNWAVDYLDSDRGYQAAIDEVVERADADEADHADSRRDEMLSERNRP